MKNLLFILLTFCTISCCKEERPSYNHYAGKYELLDKSQIPEGYDDYFELYVNHDGTQGTIVCYYYYTHPYDGSRQQASTQYFSSDVREDMLGFQNWGDYKINKQENGYVTLTRTIDVFLSGYIYPNYEGNAHFVFSENNIVIYQYAGPAKKL